MWTNIDVVVRGKEMSGNRYICGAFRECEVEMILIDIKPECFMQSTIADRLVQS